MKGKESDQPTYFDNRANSYPQRVEGNGVSRKGIGLSY